MKLRAAAILVALVACERAKTESPPAPAPPRAAADASLPVVAEAMEVPEVRIRPDASTTVHVVWRTPPGTRVNDDAPFRVRWSRSDGLAEAPRDTRSTGSAVQQGFKVDVRPMPGAPNATLGGAIDIVVCDAETHSVCVPVHKSLELGFVVVKDAAAEAKIEVPLPEAKGR